MQGPDTGGHTLEVDLHHNNHSSNNPPQAVNYQVSAKTAEALAGVGVAVAAAGAPLRRKA